MGKKVTISAPGKLMLYGEHAVVYGRPCIVTAVGQRMKATITETDEPTLLINAPDVKVENYKKPLKELGRGDIPKGAKFIEVAVKNFIKKYKVIKKGLRIETKSEFSSSFGFGSSSASTVCVIKGLSILTKTKLSNKEIFDISYKTVLDVQGKGSGFDVAAAVYGGTLYFETGGKRIKPLKVKNMPLIIGYSGIKADTVELIDKVSELAKKYPKQVDGIYDSMGDIVSIAEKALLKEDFKSLGELMNINQGYLESLGVGSAVLSRMIYAARDSGAYGAKLSGAGVGDCMIAFASSTKIKEVQNAIAKAGKEVVTAKANVEGVRVE